MPPDSSCGNAEVQLGSPAQGHSQGGTELLVIWTVPTSKKLSRGAASVPVELPHLLQREGSHLVSVTSKPWERKFEGRNHIRRDV